MMKDEVRQGNRPRRAGFDTILVANRGEIALRVFRTAQALGYRTVAVYSEADSGLPHALAADIAVCIGPPAAAESYLNIAGLIKAAERSGAQAIHPGYGFLSESAEFAAACGDAGLVFIGPSPEAIGAMANKAMAKRLMTEAGVPCIPGYDGAEQDDAVLTREAHRIGFPIMIKAVAGGGGKGMRLIENDAELEPSLHAARREAERAFGQGALMLEKAVLHARHVEVQVFGDAFGAVIHLGDRDCSIQRRHQKLIEEAPAPGLSPALRDRMARAAVQAGHAVNYQGAGTVEFLVTADEAFYFLEMNTRLQVEHPVTEIITGLDLVEWQIRIAAGERLPLTQTQLRLSGHAIEARVCAESPAGNFLPQSGQLSLWRPPDGVGIRVDHGLREGAEVSTHYDSLVAKVIAAGESRDIARRRLGRALQRFTVAGVQTNLGFLGQCLRHPAFAEAAFDTSFIETHMLVQSEPSVPDRQTVAIAAALIHDRAASRVDAALRNWHSRPSVMQRLSLAAGDWHSTVGISLSRSPLLGVADEIGEQQVLLFPQGSTSHARVDGVDYRVTIVWKGDQLQIVRNDCWFAFSEMLTPAAKKSAPGSALIYAPMPGSVTEIRVIAGAHVESGQVLAILEAMKMEHPILAPVSGRVKRLDISVGQQVAMRQDLMEIIATAHTEEKHDAV